MRLDQELVRRRLLPSRAAARRAIVEGRVAVEGVAGPRPATRIDPGTAVTVDPDATRYVGRGGHKLAAALDEFEIDPAGRRCLDVGSSTGGFTDCLLQRGAAHVVAVDVGSGQLHPAVRNDHRVTPLESTDIRQVTADAVGGRFALVAVDVSFVSLRLLVDALGSLLDPTGDLIVLVKPQFEVGIEGRRKDGVVDDDRLRLAAVDTVLEAFSHGGLVTRRTMSSPLVGGAGNIEYLAWLRHGDEDGPRA